MSNHSNGESTGQDPADDDRRNIQQARFIARWGLEIVQEGDGGGAFSYPAALDKYERALGLKPAEAWLMKRLLTFDWDGKKYVWCSFKQISREADVSYNQVLALRDSLVEKGYIRERARHSDATKYQFDNRMEYDITGLLRALDHAIKCNPDSLWAKIHGGSLTMADIFNYATGENAGKPYEPYRTFTTPKEVNEYRKQNGWASWWGDGGCEPEGHNKQVVKTLRACACGKGFYAASPNARYCPACRKERRKKSISRLVTAGAK